MGEDVSAPVISKTFVYLRGWVFIRVDDSEKKRPHVCIKIPAKPL